MFTGFPEAALDFYDDLETGLLHDQVTVVSHAA